MLYLEIPGIPRSKKNSQRIVTINGRYVPIPSKQYKEYEKQAIEALQKYKCKHISTPIEVTVVYHLPLNKDGSVPKVKVDLTNLLEGTDDILCHKDLKIIDDDNCQIIKSHDGSRVIYDNQVPRTCVAIKEFKE